MSEKLVLLTILDGWGHRINSEHNAIAKANTPVWDNLIKNYPNILISASGIDVGLPSEQMGNSEVGHLTMGAGRVLHQDLTRITKEISDGILEKKEVILDAVNYLKNNNKTIHLVGLLSDGGIHSHQEHIFSIIKTLSKLGIKNLKFHAILDGRDTPPKTAGDSIKKLSKLFDSLSFKDAFSSISGRYFTMDRDKRWDRTKLGFDAIVNNVAKYKAESALKALDLAYARGETDEFVKPTVIGESKVEDNDVILFLNFRADRARQFCQAITEHNFLEFDSNIPKINRLITLTNYSDEIKAEVIFNKPNIDKSLGEIVSENGLKQLRIAETEKYAHVTFFFNGGKEDKFLNEERVLIPSPKVSTYDEAPRMSADKITEKLVSVILEKKYNFIVCNYANADMVGHTGNLSAAIEAVECLDSCLGKLIDALSKVNGEMLITADHGNVEMMFNEQIGQPHTAHTNELVPFVYYGNKKINLVEKGYLFDVAPTILRLFGIEKPNVMTGNSLIK